MISLKKARWSRRLCFILIFVLIFVMVGAPQALATQADGEPGFSAPGGDNGSPSPSPEISPPAGGGDLGGGDLGGGDLGGGDLGGGDLGGGDLGGGDLGGGDLGGGDLGGGDLGGGDLGGGDLGGGDLGGGDLEGLDGLEGPPLDELLIDPMTLPVDQVLSIRLRVLDETGTFAPSASLPQDVFFEVRINAVPDDSLIGGYNFTHLAATQGGVSSFNVWSGKVTVSLQGCYVPRVYEFVSLNGSSQKEIELQVLSLQDQSVTLVYRKLSNVPAFGARYVVR